MGMQNKLVAKSVGSRPPALQSSAPRSGVEEVLPSRVEHTLHPGVV